MKYFDTFKVIQYNNALACDITQRAAILSSVFGDNYAFYPYEVKHGMRAEQVAEKYYGDPDFVWLVYFSNNIIDPYHDWPKDPQTFDDFIAKKYGSVQVAHQTIVKYRVNWYEDTRTLDKVLYNSLPQVEKKYWTPVFDKNNYPEYYVRKEINIDAVAQDADGNITLSIPDEEAMYWAPVSAYDVEEEDNANKAHIRLLDNRLSQVAATNLRDLLKQ